MSLRPCVACRRHVVHDVSTCPFCGAAIARSGDDAIDGARTTTLGRLSRAAVFAGAIATGAATGCYMGSQPRYEPLPPPPPSDTRPQPERLGQVRGTVTHEESGAPAVHRSVSLFGEPLRAVTGGPDSMHLDTGQDGRFTFDNIPPGEYRLVVPGASRSRDVTVRAGHAVIFAIRLEPPPRPDPRHMAKPYGAPPARRRVV